MEDVCVPLTPHTYARLARGLAFLLVAVATVVTVCVLGPLSALAASTLGAQDRAGAFNPPGVTFAGGRSVENPCSRLDSNATGGGIAVGCFVGDEDAAAADLAEDAADGAPAVLRHYTTDQGAAGILHDGVIDTSADGNVYLTTDKYANGADAQAGLNLSHTPTGYIEIPSSRVPNATGPFLVPGGTGTEILNPGPIDSTGLSFTPF